VRVLSGEQEAHFAAFGVVAGIPCFSGVVGELGGGGLEFSAIAHGIDTSVQFFPLGVVPLPDDADSSHAAASQLARDRLKDAIVVTVAPGSQFAAIGGTWRSLAKLHQVLRDYPLHMVQDYVVPAADMIKVCEDIVGADTLKSYPGASEVSNSRRELVPFGAAVLAEILKAGRFESVVFSALGVREGYL